MVPTRRSVTEETTTSAPAAPSPRRGRAVATTERKATKKTASAKKSGSATAKPAAASSGKTSGKAAGKGSGKATTRTAKVTKTTASAGTAKKPAAKKATRANGNKPTAAGVERTDSIPAPRSSGRRRSTKKASAVADNTTKLAISPAALKVREGEKPWTQRQLDEVLSELAEQREHSLAVLAAQEAELDGLMRNSGDGAGQDQADVGASTFERDHEMTVVTSERDKLAQIERAHASMAEGTYGVCQSCGEPIGKMRLLAFPRATLCVTCKQREERR